MDERERLYFGVPLEETKKRFVAEGEPIFDSDPACACREILDSAQHDTGSRLAHRVRKQIPGKGVNECAVGE